MEGKVVEFTEETTVAEVLKHPAADRLRGVFANFGLHGCGYCTHRETETLTQVCLAHRRIDASGFIAALNAAVAEAEASC